MKRQKMKISIEHEEEKLVHEPHDLYQINGDALRAEDAESIQNHSIEPESLDDSIIPVLLNEWFVSV